MRNDGENQKEEPIAGRLRSKKGRNETQSMDSQTTTAYPLGVYAGVAEEFLKAERQTQKENRQKATDGEQSDKEAEEESEDTETHNQALEKRHRIGIERRTTANQETPSTGR